jgi:hypothetical protein
MSAAERLIALLEQHNPGDPCVRQVATALRRIPQQLASWFDLYQRMVQAIGAEQAARLAMDAALEAREGWRPR